MVIKSQFWNLIGAKEQPILQLLHTPDQIQILTILTGLISAVFMWKGSKLKTRIPNAVLGLLAGTIAYYALAGSGLGVYLGATIGFIPSEWPQPRYLIPFYGIISDRSYWAFLPILIPTAFTVAVLNSIASLLSSVNMQSYMNKRVNTNRELFAEGIGSTMASLFGGLPCSGSTNRSIANYEAGGRTRISNIISSLTILIIVVFLPDTIGFIPLAVLSGIIAVIGVYMFDRPLLNLFKDLLFGKLPDSRELMLNPAITLFVAFATVLYGLITAVELGIILSVVIFILQLRSSAIRRISDGSKMHSTKHRYYKLTEILHEKGNQIAIIELDGSVFFGSADHIINKIDRLSKEATLYFILDLKRVNYVDSTAAQIILQTNEVLGKRGKILSFSYADRSTRIGKSAISLGLYKTIGERYFFEDTNSALEYFEDQILKLYAKDELDDSAGYGTKNYDRRFYNPRGIQKGGLCLPAG